MMHVGKRFNQWTVLGRVPDKHNNRRWLCMCDCGKTKELYASTVFAGTSRSCGCYRRRGTGNYVDPKFRGNNYPVILIHPENRPAGKSKYAYYHRTLIEKVLGKPIPLGVQAHHVDEDKANFSPNNLVLCQDEEYHRLLHQRARALAACGHAGWLKCVLCGVYDDPSVMYVYPVGTGKRKNPHASHRECNATYQRSRRKRLAAGG